MFPIYPEVNCLFFYLSATEIIFAPYDRICPFFDAAEMEASTL